MIDLLFTFGAVAESKTLLTNRTFDDSQDCLTYLERQARGRAVLCIGKRSPGGRQQPAPWRSL